MKLLKDNYGRLYVRLQHLTWDIKASESQLWFEQVNLPEELYSECIPGPLMGFTCEGYLEDVVTVRKVKDFNAMFYEGVTSLGLANLNDLWYPGQLRVTPRWAPAITVGSYTFEASYAYGDVTKIYNVERERAFPLLMDYVILGSSSRVLLPLRLIQEVPDGALNSRRVSVAWPAVLKSMSTQLETDWKEVLK